MLSTREALGRILALVTPTGTERIGLADASGRVLAAPVIATRAQPPFTASAMDGYAVREAEARPGLTLRVIGEAAAGARFSDPIGAGEAVRIFTGAPLPPGADFILIQEDATVTGDRITVAETRDAGPYFRPAGGDFDIGETLPAPTRLTSSHLALCAAMNAPRVEVRKKPVVALIPTGDELVWPGDEPGPDQIISSNNFGLKALLETAGAKVNLIPVARDRTEALHAALTAAEGADLIVTLGGASVGDHDLVREAFSAGGLDLSFYKVAMRPGKPLMAGRLGSAMMVGLPGNPVSSMVCGHIFLRPAIDAFLGLPAGPLSRKVARLGRDLGPNAAREHYMRADLNDGVCTAFEKQDSSLLSVLGHANALLVRPPHDPARHAGEEVEVISFDT